MGELLFVLLFFELDSSQRLQCFLPRILPVTGLSSSYAPVHYSFKCSTREEVQSNTTLNTR